MRLGGNLCFLKFRGQSQSTQINGKENLAFEMEVTHFVGGFYSQTDRRNDYLIVL